MTSSAEQTLSLRALIALVVGSMIGSGIFALPSAFGRATGVMGALIAWVVAGVGMWLADTFAEVVPEHPVLSVVTGQGETGAALCRSGVDKVAFTGSGATGRKVMAACAETLTPMLMECGGKDAFIVDEDVCTRCALCVDRCPTGVIILGKLSPQVAEGDPHTRTNRNGYAYGVRF